MRNSKKNLLILFLFFSTALLNAKEFKSGDDFDAMDKAMTAKKYQETATFVIPADGIGVKTWAETQGYLIVSFSKKNKTIGNITFCIKYDQGNFFLSVATFDPEAGKMLLEVAPLDQKGKSTP